jgi:two-component system, chemotaxis family, chemotaxis protein CheY
MANILVVEDTYLTFQLLFYFLQRNQHNILQASNGVEAIQILEENPVDLVITDIHMPEMDGLTLIGRIRADERFRHLPVIVLTASGLEKVEKLAFEKGATAFLSQPFSSRELGKLVSDCLGTIKEK